MILLTLFTLQAVVFHYSKAGTLQAVGDGLALWHSAAANYSKVSRCLHSSPLSPLPSIVSIITLIVSIVYIVFLRFPCFLCFLHFPCFLRLHCFHRLHCRTIFPPLKFTVYSVSSVFYITSSHFTFLVTSPCLHCPHSVTIQNRVIQFLLRFQCFT